VALAAWNARRAGAGARHPVSMILRQFNKNLLLVQIVRNRAQEDPYPAKGTRDKILKFSAIHSLPIVGCLPLELLGPVVPVALERGFIQPQALALEEREEEAKQLDSLRVGPGSGDRRDLAGHVDRKLHGEGLFLSGGKGQPDRLAEVDLGYGHARFTKLLQDLLQLSISFFQPGPGYDYAITRHVHLA